MSRGEVRQKWQPLLLAILLGSQFLLMTLTARSFSPVDGTEQSFLRTWVMVTLTPIQQALGSIFSSVTSVWNGYVDLRSVRERNVQLETENGELHSEVES